jgi:DNA (cytosine-5)-methyltransferase 1
VRIADLCCGAGGAAMGLHQAFPDAEIVGVDVRPQPRYPFTFVQGDALEFDLSGFDFVWASWPCQAYTAYKRRPNHVAPAPELIARGREKLQEWGGPWIMENIRGAPLRASAMLCGSMFGLDVRRHRYFEATFPILAPTCQHDHPAQFKQATNRANLRRTVEVGVWRIPLAVQQRAMGIDWMLLPELSEAVPPTYSRYLAQFIPLPLERVA